MKKWGKINRWAVRILFLLIVFFALSYYVYGFNFVVLGDSRDGENPSPILRQEMKEIKLLSPDFIIHTGDWVSYPSKQGWKNFLKVMDIGIPYYLVVGNHEVRDGWKKLYKEMIKKPFYYSFSYENSYFIILNPYVKSYEKIDSKQFNWLKSELRKGKKFDFIFVFVHEPLYPVDGHIGRSLDRYPKERDKLANLLRKYKKKLIVFCGHEHLYSKSAINGLTQIITAGAGAPLYAPPEKGGFYHYLYLTVKGKRLSIAVIKIGNIVSSDVGKEISEK